MRGYLHNDREDTWKEHITVVFRRIVDDFGYNETHIKSHRRSQDLFTQKKNVANALRAAGFSFPKIGWVMGKDHTTIMNMVKKHKANNEKKLW